MRIGLFGGTFNPIHIGHLRAGWEVKENFGIDTIYLIPSAIPPHKSPQGVVDAHDRFQMIRLAISDHSGFTVSDVELDRPGPSYSIDTVRYFQNTLPEQAQFYLILGSDAFYEIDTWREYDAFFDLIPLIIMLRPGDGYTDESHAPHHLECFLKTKISDGYGYAPDRAGFFHPEKKPVYMADIKGLDASSTRIRRMIHEKKSIRSQVPDSVVDYIESKGLYL